MPDTAEDPADNLYHALDLLEEEYSDRNGNISWRNGQDYAIAFCGTVKDHLEPLLNAKRYEAAFHCLARAFTVLDSVELDGFFGEYSEIEDTMVHYWDRVIRSVSPEDRKQIHDWLEVVNEEVSYLNCPDVIDTVLKQSFDDPEYLELLLDEAKQKLDDPELPDRRVKELLEQLRDLLLRGDKDGTQGQIRIRRKKSRSWKNWWLPVIMDGNRMAIGMHCWSAMRHRDRRVGKRLSCRRC